MNDTPTTHTGLRILIAASGRLGYAAMMPLLDSHHEIIGLVQNARSVSRWKQRLMSWQYRFTGLFPSLMREAVLRRLPIYWVETMSKRELAPLRDAKPDLLITCGFSIILSEALLKLPRIGCINVHTALLPKHPGATPCAHVILDDDLESGVSIHVTEAGIDSDALLAQERFPVEPDDNSMDVYWASYALTESMIVDVVNQVEAHGLTEATPQSLEEGHYDSRFDKYQARISWRKSAEDIERLIRAAYIYLPAYFEFRGERISVPSATYTDKNHNAYPGTILSVKPELEIATGWGSLIVHDTYTQGATAWPRMNTRLKVGMALD